MKGLLTDVNVQGHLSELTHLLAALDLLELVRSEGIGFATFPDLGLAPRLDDRSLWTFCQAEGWVLWTENRNDDGPDSLAAAVADGWRDGCLPVLTLANKGRFEHDRSYAEAVARDVAELLVGAAGGQYRDQPRIYVPQRLPASP